MAKINQSFPDPSQFKEEKEFLYAALVASVFKKVGVEILGWIDQQAATVEYLEKKKKEDTSEIGGGV